MASLNGEEFTTCYNDNGGACGVKNSGAWSCPCHLCCSTYLNAPYSNVSKVSYKQGINWFQWHGNYYALKATQMMIRKIWQPTLKFYSKNVKNNDQKCNEGVMLKSK